MAVIILGEEYGCQANCPRCKSVLIYDPQRGVVAWVTRYSGNVERRYEGIKCPKCGTHFDPEGWENGR